MPMHIKQGLYILRHSPAGPEVGQLVVVDGPPVGAPYNAVTATCLTTL